jgi:hypothetical protein
MIQVSYLSPLYTEISMQTKTDATATAREKQNLNLIVFWNFHTHHIGRISCVFRDILAHLSILSIFGLARNVLTTTIIVLLFVLCNNESFHPLIYRKCKSDLAKLSYGQNVVKLRFREFLLVALAYQRGIL